MSNLGIRTRWDISSEVYQRAMYKKDHKIQTIKSSHPVWSKSDHSVWSTCRRLWEINTRYLDSLTFQIGRFAICGEEIPNWKKKIKMYNPPKIIIWWTFLLSTSNKHPCAVVLWIVDFWLWQRTFCGTHLFREEKCFHTHVKKQDKTIPFQPFQTGFCLHCWKFVTCNILG